MSSEYQNTTNEQIARQAEADLNDHNMSGHKASTRDPKYGSDSGTFDSYIIPLRFRLLTPSNDYQPMNQASTPP